MLNNFKNLIDRAQRILITAHLSADADAISASLLLSSVLQLNLPQKEVLVSIEEVSSGLGFITGYDHIKFGKLSDSMDVFTPDLLIILDASTIARCTRNSDEVQKLLDSKGIKVAILDHHDPQGKDSVDFYYNQGSPAVTQDIYEICFGELKLAKPKGYAMTALPGIFFDTGGFVYDNPSSQKTLKIVSQLIDDGASIEKVAHELSQYSGAGLEVLAELISNISEFNGATYTFVSDGFTDKWLEAGKGSEAIKEGFDIFIMQFLRNVDRRSWGFAVYPDLMTPQKAYKVSFRSLTGSVNVLKYAQRLGGGGHEPAAGAQLQAKDMNEALQLVKQAIVK